MNIYDDGDKVRVSGTFTDDDGTPTDPLNVTIQHRFGSGDVVAKVYGTDVEVEKVSTGVYRMDIDTTGHEGTSCHYRIYSTGNGQAAQEGRFFVRRSNVLD